MYRALSLVGFCNSWVQHLMLYIWKVKLSKGENRFCQNSKIVMGFLVQYLCFCFCFFFTDNQRWLWKVPVDFWIWWKQYKVRIWLESEIVCVQWECLCSGLVKEKNIQKLYTKSHTCSKLVCLIIYKQTYNVIC